MSFAAVNVGHARAIAERLDAVYGRRTLRPDGDALGELIQTILSQSTTDTNSGRAYRTLRQRFPDWQQVLDAPTEAVYDAIKSAGLGNIKALRIQQTLHEVLGRQGDFNLNFLADLPLDQSKAWLESIKGVGPKTAACVLLFALGKPALPVDTHVYRVSQRLGLLGEKTSVAQSHTLLEAAIPPDDIYSFHVTMIQHGRRVCVVGRPRCESCPLSDLCRYAGAVIPRPDATAVQPLMQTKIPPKV